MLKSSLKKFLELMRFSQIKMKGKHMIDLGMTAWIRGLVKAGVFKEDLLMTFLVTSLVIFLVEEQDLKAEQEEDQI